MNHPYHFEIWHDSDIPLPSSMSDVRLAKTDMAAYAASLATLYQDTHAGDTKVYVVFPKARPWPTVQAIMRPSEFGSKDTGPNIEITCDRVTALAKSLSEEAVRLARLPAMLGLDPSQQQQEPAEPPAPAREDAISNVPEARAVGQEVHGHIEQMSDWLDSPDPDDELVNWDDVELEMNLALAALIRLRDFARAQQMASDG